MHKVILCHPPDHGSIYIPRHHFHVVVTNTQGLDPIKFHTGVGGSIIDEIYNSANGEFCTFYNGRKEAEITN